MVQRRLYLPETLTLPMTRLSNLDPRIAGIRYLLTKTVKLFDHEYV